jgi:hypothetical protein
MLEQHLIKPCDWYVVLKPFVTYVGGFFLFLELCRNEDCQVWRMVLGSKQTAKISIHKRMKELIGYRLIYMTRYQHSTEAKKQRCGDNNSNLRNNNIDTMKKISFTTNCYGQGTSTILFSSSASPHFRFPPSAKADNRNHLHPLPG